MPTRANAATKTTFFTKPPGKGDPYEPRLGSPRRRAANYRRGHELGYGKPHPYLLSISLCLVTGLIDRRERAGWDRDAAAP